MLISKCVNYRYPRDTPASRERTAESIQPRATIQPP
jgi:hypothetical protein